MFKNGVSTLNRKKDTSKEIHHHNPSSNHFSTKQFDAVWARAEALPLARSLSSSVFLKQLAHPGAITLLAGSQEAGFVVERRSL